MYCLPADVARVMGLDNAFSELTTPTADEVQSEIDNIASDINGVLQAIGYGLPVTDSEALRLLGHYNALGAAVGVWHSTYVSDTAPDRVKYWETSYNNFLGRLRRGEQQLPGSDDLTDTDAQFDIAATPVRDSYWTTGESLGG